LFKKTAAALAVVLTLALPVFAAGDTGSISAKSFAVVEQSSGRLIYGKNETKRMPMASTTKIMTGILAVESGRMESVVTVTDAAVRVEGSSMGLESGEKITLRDLTYGLLLESGNDAANVIAIYLGGSVGGFVRKMNEKASVLGLYDTHFDNPSGLDSDDHYTTALDLARLGAYAMNNSAFAQIAGTKSIRVTYKGKPNQRRLVNHNRLLWVLDGSTGIKTGFTKKCGRCLVSGATRGGVSFVVSSLNAPDDWDDHEKLLDYAFGAVKKYPVFKTPQSFSISVAGGTADKVALRYDSNFSAALKEGEYEKLRTEINLHKFVYAPVKAGQKLGEIVATVNGAPVAKTGLFAAADVPRLEVKGPFSWMSPFFRSAGIILKFFF